MSFKFFDLGGGAAAAETVDVVAGETVAEGEVVAVSLGAPGTAGRAYLADASDPRLSSSGAVLGIVTVGGAASATVTVQLSGTATTVSGLTSGKFYGVSSTTPGALALTADSPTIGYASSATELQLSGLVSGLSSLSAGVAYTSDGSGDLTAATVGGFGWALSATTLQITPRAWSNSVRPLGDNCYIAGGRTDNSSSYTVDDIDTFAVSTLGNASSFGELYTNLNSLSASCSLVRALYSGGETYPTKRNRISYQDVASNSLLGDFGDLTVARTYSGSASIGVLSITGGGDSGSKSDVIDKVSIASLGNSVDVGDLDAATTGECAMGNATKAFFCGGDAAAGYLDTIQTCTWASLGNAADHSNLTAARGYMKAASNSTHGLIFGGYSGSWHDEIDRLDLTSSADATDWGDLAANNAFAAGAGANATRAVFCGGRTVSGSPTVDQIQYASLASATGTIADFGDLTSPRNRAGGTSTGNGGLQ